MSFAWQTARLDSIFEIARGGSPRPIDNFITDDADGLNWVKISDATASGKYIERTKEKIRPAGLSKTRQVFPGDFLLTNSMSFGRPYIMATEGCIHDGWLLLRPRDERIVWREFFYHLLGSQAVYDRLASRAAGSTVKNLNTDIVASVEIPLPPLDEQKRIASILDKADQLRQKRRQAIALLDSLAQSIFLETFGDPVSNPRGFPHVPLSDLIDPKDRLNYGVVQPGDTLEDGVPLIRVSDLRNGAVDRSALKHIDPRISSKHSKSVLNGREILVSCVGSIGEIAVASDADRGSNVARAVARIPLKNGVSRAFVAAYLRTDAVQNYFTKELRTVSQPTLNIKQISETLIPLVALEETNRFEDKLSRHQKLQKTQDLQLHETEALFHSLQNRAFSGQL